MRRNELIAAIASADRSTASRVAAASRLPVTRRAFLGATGAAATSALAGCGSSALPGAVPPGTVPTEGPETKALKLGMIALTDCSPLIIAHEKGFFKKYGIESTISKGASWPAIRDSLSNGDIQATPMLIGMPLARPWVYSVRPSGRWSSPGCSTAPGNP